MNKQKKVNKNGTTSRGIEWTDYTWNPVRGCQHGCQWIVDRQVANCYAEDVADKVAQKAYPQGFEHHYWTPKVLTEPLRQPHPSKIFMGSMADWMGSWVPEDNINSILDIMHQAHWHTFQALTKNVPRLLKFAGKFPNNLWVGASTPPDYMFGKQLSRNQQYQMLDKTLSVFEEIRQRQPLITLWLSAEPLSWDITELIAKHIALDWIVIGAASNGKNYYPPDEMHVRDLVNQAEYYGTKVFFKGNLRSLKWASDNWRENFPG